MSDQAQVKHTKTFKKYTDQHNPELVEAVRGYAAARSDVVSLYEDDSIVKVTGLAGDVDEMVDSLRSRFGTPLPGEDPPAKSKKS